MSNFKRTCLGVTLASITMTIPALAGTVAFRQGENGYASSEDTYIRDGSDIAERSEWNMGGADHFAVQTSGGAIPAKIGLIQYQDIFGAGGGQIPADRVITSATLRLYLYQDILSTSAAKPLFVRPLLVDIPDYGSSDGAGSAGEVTWKQRELTITGWGAAGTELVSGPVPDEDFDTSMTAIETYFDLEVGTFIEIDVAPIVSAWNQGSIDNFGFMISPDVVVGEGFTAGFFRSNEWSTISQRPQLVVNYSDFAAGDFNSDGSVNGDDLIQWEGDFGLNGNSDGDGDGDSDGADFLVWQRNFTSLPALSASLAVPEPSSLLLFCGGLSLAVSGRKYFRLFRCE